MLRSSWLLFVLLTSVPAMALDRADALLPRSGQTVDRFNGDLTVSLGRTRPEIRHQDFIYTMTGDELPTLHYLKDEQRFSIPGVAATGLPETFDEKGAVRYVYHGANQAGAIEKHARIELVRFDEGRCQLSWKLSVMNRGQRLRHQLGSIAYDCR